MPSGENREVSVVILTRNSARTLERCLISVKAQEPLEILAVDARSSDGTLKILERYGVTVLLDSAGSLGYSRQLGAGTAKGPYVMFVDSDVELGPSCIMTLREELEKLGWVGIHAKIVSNEKLTYWQKAEDEAFSLFFNHAGPKANIGTIAALFRRDVLLRHPFDTNLRESCEDVDLCLRLGHSGYRVGVSSAVAYHRHRREFSAFARRRFRYGLGDARLALKYRSNRILVAPLVATFSQIVPIMRARRIRIVPYLFLGASIESIGTFAGLSRARRDLLAGLRVATQAENMSGSAFVSSGLSTHQHTVECTYVLTSANHWKPE